jgi:hypothetical protein
MWIPDSARKLLAQCVRKVTGYPNAYVARLHNRKVAAYVQDKKVLLLFTQVDADISKDTSPPIHWSTRGNMGQLVVSLSSEAAASLYGVLHEVFQNCEIPEAHCPLPDREASQS